MLKKGLLINDDDDYAEIMKLGELKQIKSRFSDGGKPRQNSLEVRNVEYIYYH